MRCAPPALVVAVAIFAFSPVSVFAVSAITLDVAIQSITESQPPHLVGDVVIFSFKPQAHVRFVGVRFAHESFAVLHPYSRNENGVFVLDYPLPEGLREIRYRIVVDGLWLNDPANPAAETDELGNPVSLFTIDTEPPVSIVNPKIEADGRLTFVYRGRAGQRVSLVGDFNDWDPFIDFFSEVEPGVFRISIRALPGSHFYSFFTEGRKLLDPNNTETGVDPDGNTVSYFRLSP
jgi:1,4-alpha-glucan branching enzyme